MKLNPAEETTKRIRKLAAMHEMTEEEFVLHCMELRIEAFQSGGADFKDLF